MRETWKLIDDFPAYSYSVSSFGQVRSEKTGRAMAQFQNQSGYVYVSLTSAQGNQVSVSVSLLVARAFLDPDPRRLFTTPINLNGYRRDNFVGNLMWRPKWFAMRYHRQFLLPPTGLLRPVYDVVTGEVYETSFDAAVRYGLLDQDIKKAYRNDDYVWPTKLKFRPVE